MLSEFFIIICLAVAFFLALKNFPKTKEATEGKKINMPNRSIWQRIFGKSSSPEEIEKEIARGQGSVIAPGDIDLAKKLYMESDPEIAKILFEANEALDRHDLREAENLSLEALRRDKHCGQAYVVIGKVAALRGAFEDALEAYKAAIKCNDDLGEAYFGLGEIQLRDENYTEAIENLQKAVNLDRGNASWHGVLGKAYMQVRQFAKAAKSLKRATSLDIDNKEYRELASEAEDKMRSHSYVSRMR